MQFQPTTLDGAFVIDADIKGDERGFFARQFCAAEFAAAGLQPAISQVNMTLSAKAFTLRGMHYQVEPKAETKVVRCLRGAIFDCIIDLRPHSASFCQWFGEILTGQNQRMMYVPKGFAHGLMTLTDDVEILYFMGSEYSPGHERGIRFDDQRFKIKWPNEPVEISDKDRAWPDFNPHWHGIDSFRELGTTAPNVLSD
jgi:dTDP-4-dehydrorhamnose 3,5-epimerase